MYSQPTGKARRSVHKEAEQKRRDVLKGCFDDLKATLMIPTDLTYSKVALLQKGIAYFIVAGKVIVQHRMENEDLKRMNAALQERLNALERN